MIKRRRFSEDIADSVLDRVIEMGLKPGDRLPTHNQLSEMLGVSLPSLREGLSLLSISGVINITHGAGTTLAVPGPDDYFKILNSVSRIKSADLKELSEFCSLFIPDLADAGLRKAESSIGILRSMIQGDISESRDRFIISHKNFHSFLAYSMKKTLKSAAFLIALNLVYTHSSMANISSQSIRFYLDSHKSLKKALQSGNKFEVEEALKGCYKFQILEAQNISILYDSFGTGSLGGSFYTMAKRFTNILKGEEHINIHLELTGGGVDNISLTEEGKTILALTQSDIAEAAYRGEGIFSKEHTHLRVVCSVKPLDLWVVTLKDRNINTLYDLKGRRIAMGAEGGDSGFVARIIFKDLGFEPGDYRPYYLSFSNALQSLGNNEVDVVFFLAHEFPSALNEQFDSDKLEFLQIPTEIINSLEKQNTFWKSSFYTLRKNSPDKINTISVATVLITESSVPEDLICRIATILNERGEKEDEISFSVSDNDISIPFHTGVVECLK